MTNLMRKKYGPIGQESTVNDIQMPCGDSKDLDIHRPT